jgi:conjugal transfer pilus assembly protein TraK
MRWWIKTLGAVLCCAAVIGQAQNRVAAVEGQSGNSPAKQVWEGATVFFTISDTEPTRLVIEGSRIRSVRFLDQDISVDKDTVTGQAYLSPKTNKKVISLFVTSVNGTTFTLMAQPAPGPATSIRLVERRVEAAEAVIKVKRPILALSQEQGITTLMLAAASGRILPGVESSPVVGLPEFRLWKGVRFVKETSHEFNGLAVDTYGLTVTGAEPIRMVEQEFYQPGVLAVAIDQQILNPGDSTKVYIAHALEQ